MQTGDKVRVKSLEEVLEIEVAYNYKDVGDPGITEFMLEYFGKEGLITSCDEYNQCVVVFDEGTWFFKKEWLELISTANAEEKVKEIVASLEREGDLHYKIKSNEEAELFAAVLLSKDYSLLKSEFVKLFERGKDCLMLYKEYGYLAYALVEEDETLVVGNDKYEPAKVEEIKNPTYDDLKPLFSDIVSEENHGLDLWDTSQEYDIVERPKHYNVFDREVIDTIKDLLDNNDNYKGFDDYCIGNSLKYIFRAGMKGDYYEDLEKARYYINKILDGKENQ